MSNTTTTTTAAPSAGGGAAAGLLASHNPLDLVFRVTDDLFASVHESRAARDLSDFVASVRWTEPFIVALLCGQLALLAATLATRRSDAAQLAILCSLTAFALAAERLNTLGKAHWRRFASQDYFDAPGLFMLLFVSGPFVLLANIIVVRMLAKLVRMYARKSRLQAMRKQQKLQGQPQGGGEETKKAK